MLFNLLTVLFVTFYAINTYHMVNSLPVLRTHFQYFICNIAITDVDFNTYKMIDSEHITSVFNQNGDLEFHVTKDHIIFKLQDAFKNVNLIDIFTIVRELKKNNNVHLAVKSVNTNKIIAIDNEPVVRPTIEEGFLYWILIVNGQEIYLKDYRNEDYKIAFYAFDFSQTSEQRIEDNDSCVTVRWIGAYDTNTESTEFSFEESLEWEASRKQREVAAQIFSDFEELERKTVMQCNYIDTVSVGIMYKNSDVVLAYDADVTSFSFGPMLIAKTDAKNFMQTKTANVNSHSEAFIATNALPVAIVVRTKNITTEKLAIVEKIAEEKGLEIIRL